MIAITGRPNYGINNLDTPTTYSVAKWAAANNPMVYVLACTGIALTSYYVIIEMYEYNSDILLSRSIYKPMLTSPTTGTITANVSRFVKSYLKNKYVKPLDSTVVNCIDQSNTVGFYIKINEYDSTGLLSAISDGTNICYAINSAKQIGDLFGQSMGEYVPFGIARPNRNKAKFLTKFKQPRYFQDYPFTLSFIYSESLAGAEIKKAEDELNINKVSLNTTETQLDRSKVAAVNMLQLKSTYPTGTEFVNVSLKVGVAVAETYTYPGYVVTGYTETT